MKKDIKWLKEWLDEYENETFNEIGDIRTNGGFGERLREGPLMRELLAITNVQEKLAQLDEPEVLSQELPVIPKFVAEWYESEGNRNSWWNWFYKWGRDESRTELESKTIRWMQYFNEEVFVNMFLHGYMVEEEQKYQVIIRDGEYMRLYLCKYDGNVTIGTNDNYIEKCPEVTHLTEQEIKDYDERYWPFAVKVKELEE